MKTRPELITRSGKSTVLNNFLTNLRENDLHYENNKITQCVFLGVLKLKPIPSVFSKNKPTSNRNLTLRDRSKNIKNHPVKDTNKVISGKITKKNPETIKASVKKNPAKKSQIIRGKSKMNEDPTSSGERNDQHLFNISDPLNQTKTAVGSSSVQFNPVQNLFDKMKGKSDKYIENIQCKKKKGPSSCCSDVSDNSGNKLFLSEAEKKSSVSDELEYSSSPDSLLHQVHTKISHFTTESPDKIKELFAENNPTEEIIMVDTDLGETKQKERSSPRFRRVSIMEGNSRTKKFKEKPTSSTSSSVKQNINTKSNMRNWFNQNETILIDDYNTVSNKPHTITCDDDVICLGELKNKKENVMKDQEKSDCTEIVNQSPSKSIKKSKSSFDSEYSTNIISDNPNKDVIIISTMLTEPTQDLIGTSNLQPQNTENKDTTGDIILIPEKSTQKSKSRRSRQIPAPIPSIFLQTPRLLRSELSQKNLRKENEKPPKKISPRMQKSNNASSSVKANHAGKPSESTKKHKSQAAHDMMNEDTIFFSEEIKTPNQEGKPSLKLIIRQKKKTDVFQSQSVCQNSESPTCPDGEVLNKKSPTATDITEKNKMLDNNEKMADTSKYKNRKTKTLEIIDKIDITGDITQMESTTQKPPTYDSLLLTHDDGVEQLIQDLTNDDILDIPYCDLSKSSLRTSNSSGKVSDQSSTSISIVDSVADSCLLTNKNNFEKSPRSSRSLQSNKEKEVFQESTRVSSTQSFASEDGSTDTFDYIITIPDESSNSDIKEIPIGNDEVINITEEKSFTDKFDTSSEIMSVNDNSKDIQPGISKIRVLRSNKSNKDVPQIVPNKQNTNMNDNIDSKMSQEGSGVHEASSSNLGVHTTEINEESNLIVQDDEIIVSDDDQVTISKPRLLRSCKSKHEVGTKNLKFNNDEIIQKVQENTHNEVKGISEVVSLISEENIAITKFENSLKTSPKLPGERPGVKTSTTEKSVKSRMLRSNKSSQPSSCENIDNKSSSSDPKPSSELFKEETIEINEKVPKENLSIGNESLKLSSNGDQIDNHSPRVTRINRSKQCDDKIPENVDTLIVTDNKLSVSQEKPKKNKTTLGANVSGCSPIEDKLNNEHTTVKTLRSHSSKENSQINDNTDISPSVDEMEEHTSSEDLLQPVSTSKSKTRMWKNDQKIETLQSDDNFVDITEENDKNIETNVISCNKFYSNEQSSSEFLSTKSVNPIPDKQSITIKKTAKRALHKGKKKKIVVATKSLTRIYQIKNKNTKNMGKLTSAKLATRKSKKTTFKLSSKQEGSKSKNNITMTENDMEQIINRKLEKITKEDTNQEIPDIEVIEDCDEKNVIVEDQYENVPELLSENLVKETPRKTKAPKQKKISSQDTSPKNKVKITGRKKKSITPRIVQQNASENEQESVKKEVSNENLASEFVGDAHEKKSLIVAEHNEHVPELLSENSVKETPGKTKAQKRKKLSRQDNSPNNKVENEVKITGRRKKSIIPRNVQQNSSDNEQDSAKNYVSNIKSNTTSSREFVGGKIIKEDTRQEIQVIEVIEDSDEKNVVIVEHQNENVPELLSENLVKETPRKAKAPKQKKISSQDNSSKNKVKVTGRKKKSITSRNVQQNSYENEQETEKKEVSNENVGSEFVGDAHKKNSFIVEDQNKHMPEPIPENLVKEAPGKSKAQKGKKLSHPDNSLNNKVENEVNITGRKKKSTTPRNFQQTSSENEQDSAKNYVFIVNSSKTNSSSEFVGDAEDINSFIVEDENEHVPEPLPENSMKALPGQSKAQKRRKLSHADNSLINKVKNEVKITGRRKKSIIPGNVQENKQESSKNDVSNIKSSSKNPDTEIVGDANENTKNLDEGKKVKTTGRRKKRNISDVEQNTPKNEHNSKKNYVPITKSSKENPDSDIVEHGNESLIVQDQKKHNTELLGEILVKKAPRRNKRQKQKILNIQDESPKNTSVTEETVPSESAKGDKKNVEKEKKFKFNRKGKIKIISQNVQENISEIEQEIIGSAIEKNSLNVPELVPEKLEKKTRGKTKVRKQKQLNNQDINLQNLTSTEESVSSKSCEVEKKNVAVGNTVKATGRRKKINIYDSVQQNTPENEQDCKKDNVSIIYSTKEISVREIIEESIEKNSSIVPKLSPEKMIKNTPGKAKVQKQKQLNNKDKSTKHLTITQETVPSESRKEEKKNLDVKKVKTTGKRKKKDISKNALQNTTENEQDRTEDNVSIIKSSKTENPENKIIGNANEKNSLSVEDQNKHVPEKSVMKTSGKNKVQKQNGNQGDSPKTVNEENVKPEPDKIRGTRKRKKSESSSLKVSKSKLKKKCDSFDSIQIAEIVNSIQAIEISEQKSVENDTNTIESKNGQDEIVQTEGKSWIDMGPPIKKRKGRPKKMEGKKLEKESETKVLKRNHSELSVTQLNTPVKNNKLYEEIQAPKRVRKSATSAPKRNDDPNSSITESIERVVAGILPCKIDTTVFDFEDEDHDEPVQLRCKTKNDNIEIQKVPQNLKAEHQNTSSQTTSPLKSPMKQTTIKEMFQKLEMKKRNLAKSEDNTIAIPPPTDNSGTTSVEVVEKESEERLREQNTCQMKPPPPRPSRNEEFDDAESFFDDDSRSEWMPEEYAEYKFKYSAKKYKPLIYRCKICLMTLPSYLRLVKHKESHVKAADPYECKHCKERFSQVEDLVAHLKIHKGEQPYKCSKCTEGFWTKEEYDKHRPIHILRKVKEAPKKYQCDLCGKAFVKLCDMDRHTRVHTGEKPCICNICGKRFQQSHNLSKHLIIHLHIKPYSCEICSQQFGRADVLSRHVLTHAVEKPFKCSLCPKTFIRQIQLSKHLDEHSKKSVVVDSSRQEPQDSNNTERPKAKTGKTRKKIKSEVSEVPNSDNAVEVDSSIQRPPDSSDTKRSKEPQDSNNTERPKPKTGKTRKKIKTEVSEVPNSANAVEVDSSIQQPPDSSDTKRSKATTQKTRKKIKTEVAEVSNFDA